MKLIWNNLSNFSIIKHSSVISQPIIGDTYNIILQDNDNLITQDGDFIIHQI